MKKKRDVPPELVLYDGPDELVARGRLSLETIWLNQGGSGVGLRIAAWGPGLDHGILELTHAVLGPRDAERRVELAVSRSETGVLVDVEVADWALGAGFDRKGGGVADSELRAIAASMVAVQLHGTVVRPGLTQLHFTVCPLGVEQSDVLSLEVRAANER